MIAERNPRQRRELELQSRGSALGRRGTNENEDDKSGRVRIRKAKTKKTEVNASDRHVPNGRRGGGETL